MIDHANELRRHARKIPHPQGETPGVMLRAADEIERLQSMIASPYSMTRDDVIKLAREAGDDVEHTLPSDLDFLERFAALIAAPSAPDDVLKDAERYRFLEHLCATGTYRGIISRNAVDAAMLAAAPEAKP